MLILLSRLTNFVENYSTSKSRNQADGTIRNPIRGDAIYR